ncbi:GumC family protein [Novosphingobium lindaniclasticum]|nr:capsular exopolysaccharide synthesis family protein [Novosphingobium sp. ST904]
MNNPYPSAPEGAMNINDRFAGAYDAAGFGGVDLNLNAIRAAIIRNRWILIGTAIACLLVGVLVAMLSTPIYEAKTTLQIEQQAPQVLGNSGQSLDESGRDDSYIETQVNLLSSRSLVERVARAQNLFRDATFFTRMDRDPPTSAPGSEGWQRAVIDMLQSNLSVELIPGTRLVEVHFTSPDPKLAQIIANEFGVQFINSTLKRRFDTSDYSRKFLQDQIERTRVQLERSERALIIFAQQAGITEVDSGGSGSAAGGSGSKSLTDSNLEAINAAYAKASTDRILAEQKWQQASRSPLLQIPDVLSNSSIQGMMSSRGEKAAVLQGEMQRHAEAYPTVIKAKAELAAIDAVINNAAERVRGSIRDQYQIAVDQENSLKSSVEEMRQKSLAEQGRGVQLSILRRDADTNRALYDALLQRYREINAASGVTINNISVIDKAEIPRSPVWPKPLFNALIGAIIGVVLGVLIALVRERLDDSIRSPDEVERKFGLPLLGLLPLSKAGSVRDELNDPGSAFSESIYSIRTSLQMATAHGLPRTLAMSSTQQGEGKSTTSMAIAREIAQSGSRTLLIDADLRRPSLHALFDLKNDQGFSNYLTGQAPFDGLIVQTDTANLSVLPSGPLPLSAPRLLTHEVLVPALAELGKYYDVIMLDCPPVLGLADALQLTSCVEATLFAHEAGKASQHQAQTALRRLARGGANLIGVILTKFDFDRGGHSSYGYTQYYYQYTAGGEGKN